MPAIPALRTAGNTPERADLGLLAREVVKAYKAFFGRGPTSARIERLADGRLVCRLGEVLTPPERILVDLGHAELVREARTVAHPAMVATLVEAGARAGGRRVADVTLRVDPQTDTAVEEFRFL